ncbi:hypothetical protein DFH11DRAFT_1272256 [Phellopilus nigrolimitatus]|nr:hypothetical protein DFH11DRAFT_1272256 [Phellopilus nigrolimitatus]
MLSRAVVLCPVLLRDAFLLQNCVERCSGCLQTIERYNSSTSNCQGPRRSSLSVPAFLVDLYSPPCHLDSSLVVFPHPSTHHFYRLRFCVSCLAKFRNPHMAISAAFPILDVFPRYF